MHTARGGYSRALALRADLGEGVEEHGCRAVCLLRDDDCMNMRLC